MSLGDEVLIESGKFTLDQQTGILTIRSVNPAQDKGVYSCTARVRQGHTARREFSIDVVGKLKQCFIFFIKPPIQSLLFTPSLNPNPTQTQTQRAMRSS